MLRRLSFCTHRKIDEGEIGDLWACNVDAHDVRGELELRFHIARQADRKSVV